MTYSPLWTSGLGLVVLGLHSSWWCHTKCSQKLRSEAANASLQCLREASRFPARGFRAQGFETGFLGVSIGAKDLAPNPGSDKPKSLASALGKDLAGWL